MPQTAEKTSRHRETFFYVMKVGFRSPIHYTVYSSLVGVINCIRFCCVLRSDKGRQYIPWSQAFPHSFWGEGVGGRRGWGKEVGLEGRSWGCCFLVLCCCPRSYHRTKRIVSSILRSWCIFSRYLSISNYFFSMLFFHSKLLMQKILTQGLDLSPVPWNPILDCISWLTKAQSLEAALYCKHILCPPCVITLESCNRPCCDNTLKLQPLPWAELALFATRYSNFLIFSVELLIKLTGITGKQLFCMILLETCNIFNITSG